MTVIPTVALTTPSGRQRSYDQIEMDVIKAAIAHSKGNISLAAKRLGIGRSTIHRKLAALK